MKDLKIISGCMATAVMIGLSACHHSNPPLYLPKKITPLNTVVAPGQKDNDLLPWKGLYHLEIINSVGEVYATQSERFISENSNWLNVDFSTKSIVAVRTLLDAYDYWQYTKVLNFSLYNGEDDSYLQHGDYVLNIDETYNSYPVEVLEDESQYRIYQIAFVTDKLPSDAQIKMTWSITTTPTPK